MTKSLQKNKVLIRSFCALGIVSLVFGEVGAGGAWFRGEAKAYVKEAVGGVAYAEELHSDEWFAMRAEVAEAEATAERIVQMIEVTYPARETAIGLEVQKYYEEKHAETYAVIQKEEALRQAEEERRAKEEQERREAEKAREEEQARAAQASQKGLTLANNPAFVMTLSDAEVVCLQRIVEAEASGEDMYGKILVANVVLNRVISSGFPNTVSGVVFQQGQFSPVRNGRYDSVTVSEETKEAVRRALQGEDYSKGALYFFARQYTSAESASWFDTCLTKVAQYGCHEFYK